MAENRFCANCGAPLAPGARFCQSCGSTVAAPTAPPPAAYPAPSYPPPQPMPSYPPPAPVYQQPYARPVSRPRIRMSFLSIVGLALGACLLLLLLARTVALNTVGVTTMGVVTSVGPTGNEDYQYQVDYSYTTQDGSHQTGTTTYSNVTNITTLPTEGQYIKVRYLPFLPSMSSVVK